MAKILIIGCGAIGSKLASALSEEGHDVTGLKRTPPKMQSDGWSYYSVDISEASDLNGIPTDFEQIFFIVAPGQRSEESYHRIYHTGINNLCTHFAQSEVFPHWTFVSSTSVYNQSQGEWVDEDSPAEATTPTSKLIRQAEIQLLNSFVNSTIVRFSGIYGAGRNRLLKMAKTSPKIQCKPPYYTNRIHEQDCIAILIFLLHQSLAGKPLESYYLATDDKPAPQWEVMTWLAEQMQTQGPTAKFVDNHPAMNKRCRNEKIKALGYRFQYPTFRDGYEEMLRNHPPSN